MVDVNHEFVPTVGNGNAEPVVGPQTGIVADVVVAQLNQDAIPESVTRAAGTQGGARADDPPVYFGVGGYDFQRDRL